MKTKNIYRTGITALALILMLAACGNLIEPGVNTLSGETIPQGMGLVRIRLNAGDGARTALPGMEGYYFTLEFTAPGKTSVERELNGGTSVTMALEPAIWTLEVKAYTDSEMSTLKATGRSNVPITEGTASSFDVHLTPNFSSRGRGSLVYSISFPATVSRAFFALYPLDASGTSREIDISSDAGGTASDTLIDLPGGSYRAVVDLYDGANNEAAVWTGAAHIYDGLSTPLTHMFNTADFAECDPVIGTGETTLAAKLDAALASPAGSYTIVLDGTETDRGYFYSPLNVTDNKDIAVTIRGNGETVQVPGGFILGAESGSSLSLELHDLTLMGQSGARNSVVQVNEGGVLEIKAGVIITGNTDAFYTYGGGVYVGGGTFIMSGGSVSDNTAYGHSSTYSYGGGVYVDSGTFTMSGGSVSGNSSRSAHTYGGGVYVSGGIFAMSGGSISYNEFFIGGGVYVGGGIFTMSGGMVGRNSGHHARGVYVSSGSFVMSGGLVSDNTSEGMIGGFNGIGGGVYVVDGTFTMNGGSVTDNLSLSGGGVYVSGGTFIMNRGEVSGNRASPTGGSPYGGGVYVSGGGTFIMNGGEVSDNNASSAVGGVYSGGTFAMNGGTISGNGGGGVEVSGGFFTMNNGVIIGNFIRGVEVSGGFFTMRDGAISGNSGRGVEVSGGTFTMSNGVISGNSGGGVSVNGYRTTFTMLGGTISGNTASSGGGVIVSSQGTFYMSGGTVNNNMLSSADGIGREVRLWSTNSNLRMSGDAWPERVSLYGDTYYSSPISISGPLGGERLTTIDLQCSHSLAANWENKPILKLDDSYSSGDLASLKAHFTLGNAIQSYTETPITGYKIDDDGYFVAE